MKNNREQKYVKFKEYPKERCNCPACRKSKKDKSINKDRRRFYKEEINTIIKEEVI